MIPFSQNLKVFLAPGTTDMRKSFDGLYALVAETLGSDPLSGHLFCFSNRRRDRLKLLFWDGSGLCVFAKRLERGTFAWPSDATGRVEMSITDLAMLLAGIEATATKRRRWYRLSDTVPASA